MKLPERARVFISGGGGGLGRALACLLGQRGARVLVADLKQEGADETAARVRNCGGEAIAFKCDVTSPEQVEAAAAEMDRVWGGADLVVNNAGVAGGGVLGEVSLQDWEWILRVNLWGTLHGCHVFVPRLKAAGKGQILNVASAAGFASLPEMASYNMSKAAVISLSETLYAELGQHGVHVSVLCPTFFESGLMDSFRSPDARQREMAQAFFKRSRATSETVARAALKGLEEGRLHIVPMADGKLVWGLKRWAPGLYFRALRRGHRHITDRLLQPKR